MRRIVLKNAIDEAFMRIVEDRSLFLTPEHLLLPFLQDTETCLMLASMGVDAKVLTEMTTEHLAILPKQKGERVPLFFSMAINRIKHRLLAKGKDWRNPDSIFAEHFIEACAYEGLADSDIPSSIPLLLLGQRHSKIELAVYGRLPSV